MSPGRVVALRRPRRRAQRARRRWPRLLAQRPQLRGLEGDHHRLAVRRRPPRRTGRHGPGTPRGRHRSTASRRNTTKVTTLTLLRAMTSSPHMREDCGGPPARADDVSCRCARPGPPILAAGGSPAPPRCRSTITRASPTIPRARWTSTASSSASTGRNGVHETARNLDVIPPARREPGLQPHRRHQLGRREGGRILLPLECYDPKSPANTCGIGGFGVADPDTLTWRYWVKLDPADIPKAMWSEVAPDGKLIWTSSGQDLLAYNAADISRARSAPVGRRARSGRPGGWSALFRDRDHRRRVRRAAAVRRRPGGRPLPGQLDRPDHGCRQAGDRRDDQRRVRGARHRGGQGRDAPAGSIQPFNPEGNPPTYSPDHATLACFRPPVAGAAVSVGAGGAARAPGSRRTIRSPSIASAGPCCGAAGSRPESCARRAAGRRRLVKRGHHLLARTIKRVRPGLGS